MSKKSMLPDSPIRVVGLLVWSLTSLLLLAGCGTVELDNSPPAGFNLSGEWLREGYDADAVQRRDSGLHSGFLNQDFPLLAARSLRIEQDGKSMGIEFARGSYRDVTWGERRRGVWEIRAGWHEGDLHIYSEAADTSAVEIYRLEEDGQRLLISVEVKSHGRTEKYSRVFVRQSGI